MTDPFDLQRFIDAQEPVYQRVLAELRGVRSKVTGCGSFFPSMRMLAASGMREPSVAPPGRVQVILSPAEANTARSSSCSHRR